MKQGEETWGENGSLRDFIQELLGGGKDAIFDLSFATGQDICLPFFFFLSYHFHNTGHIHGESVFGFRFFLTSGGSLAV